MPKIVDHDERRTVALTATWRVIAQHGIDATTIREIAREAGMSTGALAHYFPTKDAILRSALEVADDHVRERIEAISAQMTGLAALREVLAQALPLDDERALELTLDVNFWARALNHPPLRTLQHLDHDRWRDIIVDLVRRAADEGELTATVSAEDLADVLVAFVDGIGLQGLVYPELVTRERIEHLLDIVLAPYAVAPPAEQSAPARSGRPRATATTTAGRSGTGRPNRRRQG